MHVTDIFIRRPVLASVISLLILILGLRAITALPVTQYPKTRSTIIRVQTIYYGAAPRIVAGFITTPLEAALSQVNGIDYMSSTSKAGVSTITVFLRLNYSPDKALSEINAKLSSVTSQLPPGTQQPQITIGAGETIDAMYIGFFSKQLRANQITDYLKRVIQPKLQAIPGVQTAEIVGGKYFALRAWLNPNELAAYGLTADDVFRALSANNAVSGIGHTKGSLTEISLNASTNLHSLHAFRNLVITHSGTALIRLKDVARVSLGDADYNSHASFDRKNAQFIGIKPAPGANLLDVIRRVRLQFPNLERQLPQGLRAKIVYDATQFVSNSIHEVIQTLVEAVLIVSFVVFLFLRSPRAVLIPIVAIPLSLVGTFAIMLLLGFSINLLTLLALVLAIGLVVDDAIIVVENVNRHIESGITPLSATIAAARELSGPIVAMTVVLIAVYVPIGFQGGLTGALFTEFAFTLVAAVTVSAIVALTLSPMMTSRLLKAADIGTASPAGYIGASIEAFFARARSWYSRTLKTNLDYLPVTLLFTAIILTSIYIFYSHARSQLAPQEDQGIILSFSTSEPDATLKQRLIYDSQTNDIMARFPETSHTFQFEEGGQDVTGAVLKSWDQRNRTTKTLLPLFQRALNNVTGQQIIAFQPPPLPGSIGLPIQFVIETTNRFTNLDVVAKHFLRKARATGDFVILKSDLRIDKPQSTILINRDKASLMGLKMNDVGDALSAMLGGGYVNYFDLYGRPYKVIPQVQQKFRFNPSQVLNYYIHLANGKEVQLSTIAHIVTKTQPESINHFQQLNSATIEGVPAPGVSLGEAMSVLKRLASETLPSGYNIDYAGQLRQLRQETGGFFATFTFALVIIFLALSALFESFRDPLIILISVPMSIAGALFFVDMIPSASLNIYTEVGLVTLMGLISKHGILIVEVANTLQRQGLSKREAIEEACHIRLRPILMTTAAMVLGVIPLLLATGAGASSRFAMGLVISTGLSVGTIFTLFVVPAMYLLLAERHHENIAS
jgi:multidrug efflux pump